MSEYVQKLFLDDVRSAPDSTWSVVRSYDAFVAHIKNYGLPQIISFDHDLAPEHYASSGYTGPSSEPTGYDCAKWLAEQGMFPSLAIVHSLNPVGAMNIAQLLRPHCTVIIAPRLMN